MPTNSAPDEADCEVCMIARLGRESTGKGEIYFCTYQVTRRLDFPFFVNFQREVCQLGPLVDLNGIQAWNVS